MTRNLIFVPLVLAMGVVLADDVPKAKPANTAPEAQEKKKEEAQKKTTQVAQEKQKEETQAPAKEEPNVKESPNLGMSILGNQEAPKSLVIVPWKSSEIGDALDISTMLGDSRQPIDKEVFMRALSYYEIRSEPVRPEGVPVTGRETAPAESNAAHRRKQ